jgi:hypothetical protein
MAAGIPQARPHRNYPMLGRFSVLIRASAVLHQIGGVCSAWVKHPPELEGLFTR